MRFYGFRQELSLLYFVTSLFTHRARLFAGDGKRIDHRPLTLPLPANAAIDIFGANNASGDKTGDDGVIHRDLAQARLGTHYVGATIADIGNIGYVVNDERRQYRLTALGRRVACAEAARLAVLVRAARRRGLLEPQTASRRGSATP